MKHLKSLVATILSVILFSAVLQLERRGRAYSAQNFGQTIPQSTSTTADAQKRFLWPNWTVRYESGSLGLKPGQWLEIAFVQRLALTQIKPSISVPARQLVAIEFNAKTEKESDLLEGPRSGCGYAPSMMPDTSRSQPEEMVAVAITLRPISRFAERLWAKHPVRFVWNDTGKQESMLVKVHDCEYKPFMANIRWMLGARWQEMGRKFKP